MNGIGISNKPIQNNFQNFNNVNMSYSGINNNNINSTGYIPYSDNCPINLFHQNKIPLPNNANQNDMNQLNLFNYQQNIILQNKLNLNNNYININPLNNNINQINYNNNNIIKKEKEIKKEETDSDLIQGLSGNYLNETEDNYSEKTLKNEIIINLGKIVVNEQILNNFPVIQIKNENKYDLSLTENILNNDDFFTAIKDNKEEEKKEMDIEEDKEEEKVIISDNYILNIDEKIYNNLKEFMNNDEIKTCANYKKLLLKKGIEILYDKCKEIILEIKRNIKNRVKKIKSFELSKILNNIFTLHNDLYNKFLISQNKNPIEKNKEFYTYIQYYIENSNGKTYKCEICSKEFINFHKLGGHMSKMHPNCSEKYKKQNDVRKQREGNRKVLDYVKEKLFEKYNLNYRKMKKNDEKEKIKSFIKIHQKEYEILRRKIQRENALKNEEE